jgi:hypothetical protein
LEIENSEVFFGENDQIYSFLRRDQLKVEIIDGHYKFSTKVTDQDGNVIAEISRNEWMIQLPPTILDRNYNDDTLEVKDARGDIILQVRALPDRIQVQGVWWTDASPCSEPRVRIAIYTMQILEIHRGKPLIVGSQLMIQRPREGEQADVMEPLLHLGQLKETPRDHYRSLSERY